MKDKETPLGVVRQWEKIMPGIYNEIESLEINNNPIAPGWPKFRDTSIELNLAGLFCSIGFDSQSASYTATTVAACYMWRKNKIIYSFDEDLSRVLAAQANDLKDTDILPADILMHPPYPCTFIKTDVIDGMGGFWYWVGYDLETNTTSIHIQFLAEDMEGSAPAGLNLLPGKTIRECCDDTLADAVRYAPSHNIEEPLSYDKQTLHMLLVALQFILYIVSENADVQDVPPNGVTKVKKAPHRILDKASEVKEKSVGVRIGNAIRKYRSSSHSSSKGKTGFTKCPHSRRGHWHHYWVGPRDGNRTLILKWIAPTFIHQDAFCNETVVVFPVKQ